MPPATLTLITMKRLLTACLLLAAPLARAYVVLNAND
jgi:hypothetical protein